MLAVTEIDKILERFKKSNELLELIQKVSQMLIAELLNSKVDSGSTLLENGNKVHPAMSVSGKNNNYSVFQMTVFDLQNWNK